MGELTSPYHFNWHRTDKKCGYQIEYCITDICNRSCKSCSHLAPLALKPNFAGTEEFTRVVTKIKRLVSDVHTFWLTGGEPTLHPYFLELLKILRNLYPNCYVGIYSNGITLRKYEDDEDFWFFMRSNGIVWAITNYDIDTAYFIELFAKHNCSNNLVIIQSGKYFLRLTNYSPKQAISQEKYEKCGWERSKINIRNGKIYNCPSTEFVDLFNAYFGENLQIGAADYLIIDDKLTEKQIIDFKGPIPFCGQCDISTRMQFFRNTKSKRDKAEWSSLK